MFQVEVFLDLDCPYSRKCFKTLYEGSVIQAYEGKPVQFLVQNVIQPWHPVGSLMHEVSLAVKSIKPQVRLRSRQEPTHPPTHLFIHSPTCSSTYSTPNKFTHPPTHPTTYQNNRPSTPTSTKCSTTWRTSRTRPRPNKPASKSTPPLSRSPVRASHPPTHPPTYLLPQSSRTYPHIPPTYLSIHPPTYLPINKITVEVGVDGKQLEERIALTGGGNSGTDTTQDVKVSTVHLLTHSFVSSTHPPTHPPNTVGDEVSPRAWRACDADGLYQWAGGQLCFECLYFGGVEGAAG